MSDLPENDLQRLLAEQPFVRSLAKQLVVEDADELVQQTYLRAIEDGAAGIEKPRNWLGQIVRHLAANMRRGNRRREQHHRAAAVQAMVPSAAELVAREEVRKALIAAVNRLSPPLRTVVLLRWFEGLPPRKIAELLQVPAATVSTQLQRAHERLRHLLDAEHGGDRRAWLLPLVPLAARPPLPTPPLTPALPAMTTGAIVMTIKGKMMIAAALAAAAGAWMWAGGSVEPPTAPPVATGGDNVDPAHAGTDQPPDVLASEVDDVAREVVAAKAPEPTVATTGSLIVHLRFAEDQTPAPGRMMVLVRRGLDSRFAGTRRRTDETGTIRYDDVPPGSMYVSPVNHRGKRVEIVSDEVAEVDVEVEIGMTLHGTVVDQAKRPVAGALVETTIMASADAYPEVMAVTGADGRFTIRAANKWCLVAARAEGHTASNVRFLLSKEGNTSDVELVLGNAGGSVAGVVVDAAGDPVANAAVIIGEGELSGITGRENIPPFAALARTDEHGKFLALGIVPGKQRMQSRAVGFAPWSGDCQVTAGATETVRISLHAGATIHGVVYDDAGNAANATELRIGESSDVGFVRVQSGADGSFVMSGLQAGERTIKANHDKLGKAEVTITIKAGEAATADLHLSLGFQLRGRVVDSHGNPVPRVYCECMADIPSGKPWFARAKTDAHGRFVAANCPEKGLATIRIRTSGYETLWQQGIDPKAGEVQLKLQRSASKSARMTLTVLTSDGLPVNNATVFAAHPEGGASDGVQVTDEHGRVELGPYAPGSWCVHVQHHDHASFISDERTLTANEALDLGTVTLARGGTVVVRRLGEADAKVRFFAMDVAMKGSVEFTEGGGEIRSRALAQGNYLLLTTGTGFTALAVPFAIRPGETTTVAVDVQKATEQSFSITWADAKTSRGIALKVMRDDVVMARFWARVGEDGSAVASTCLLPGSYTISALMGEPAGSTSFTVGAVASSPVVVTLR